MLSMPGWDARRSTLRAQAVRGGLDDDRDESMALSAAFSDVRVSRWACASLNVVAIVSMLGFLRLGWKRSFSIRDEV